MYTAKLLQIIREIWEENAERNKLHSLRCLSQLLTLSCSRPTRRTYDSIHTTNFAFNTGTTLIQVLLSLSLSGVRQVTLLNWIVKPKAALVVVLLSNHAESLLFRIVW
jgi:hypothetical protein